MPIPTYNEKRLIFVWIDYWMCRYKSISTDDIATAFDISTQTASLILGIYAGSRQKTSNGINVKMGRKIVSIEGHIPPQYTQQEYNKVRKLVKYDPLYPHKPRKPSL